MEQPEFIFDRLIPVGLRTDVETRRRARLLVYAVLIASLASLLSSAMMAYLGHTETSLGLLLTLLVYPITLGMLWVTGSTRGPAHVFMVLIFASIVMDYGPDDGYGVLATIGLPVAASALLGVSGGVLWTLIGAVWAGYFGPVVFRAADFAHTLGLSSAIMTVVIGVAATIIESLRARAHAEAASERERRRGFQQRIQAFAEKAFPAIAVTCQDSIEHASSGVEELLGYAPQEFCQQLIEDYIHTDDLRDFSDRSMNRSASGFRSELRMRHRDGAWVWTEIFRIPLGELDEHRWVFAARGIQTERDTRESLQQAQRLESLGVLAAGLAHDFNNLLTVIVGRADLLGSGEDREQILTAAKHAAELTRSLMSFGRRPSSQGQLVEINAVATKLSPLFESLLGPRISLTVTLPDPPVCVYLSEGQLDQVLLNFMTNAWEAIRDGGEVEFVARGLTLEAQEARALDLAAGEYICLSVKDNGIGMSDETRAHAFDPFYSTKPAHSGSGLGLASAYGIVRQAGGAVEVDSEQGVGTIVRMYLPAADAQATQEREDAAPVRAGTARVLLVEDEEPVRVVLTKMLRHQGFEVDPAQNGDEALRLAQAHHPNIVVSDIMMPGMRGTELAARLRQNDATLPVLFVSGYPSSDYDAGSISNDANARFLAKPFRSHEVARQIDELLYESSE